MAGLSGRGELSVSQEDTRELQRRSEGETRLRNSERLIRARDAHRRFQHEHLPSHFNAESVGGINQTLTESQDRLITASPRPDSPIPAPQYRPVGQTEDANELHVRHNQPATERTRWSDSTLESRLAPAGGQNILSLEPLQPTQAQSYMPTLRSQPEFYMTGVIAVGTTAEPLPDNAECTICLEPLSDDVVKFHACGHMFHTVCVQSWFDQSAPRTGVKRGTCPNCRHELYEPDPRFGRPNAQQTLLAEPARSHMPAPPRLTTGDVVQAVPPALPRAVETPTTNAPRVTGGSNRDPRLAQFIANSQGRVGAHEQQERQAANAPAPAPEAVSVTRVPHLAPGTHLPGYAPHRIESSESPRGGTTERDMPTVRLPPAQPRPTNATDGSRQANSQDQMLFYQQMFNQQRQNALNHSRFSALGRSAASIAMTDALRRPAAPARESEAGDRLEDSAESDGRPRIPDADDLPGVVGRSTFTPERPPTSRFTPNGTSEQPRESRATLAARAIAERRPLSEVPGLSNREVNPSRPAHPSMRLSSTSGNWEQVLATRTTDQLRDEQVMLLDRLRAVQTQIGRNLEASGERATNAAERREQLREMARNNPHNAHLYGGPAPAAQDSTSTHRPPPIAIPRIADPSVTDLRSSRELPDPRAIGTGNTIWSTEYVAPPENMWNRLNPYSVSNGSLGSPNGPYPSSPGFHRDDSRIHSPLFTFSPDGPRTATESNLLRRRIFNDELLALPASTTRSETAAAAQPASEGNQNAAAEDTQSVRHPRRISSTVVRHMHDDSLPLRDTSTDPAAISQRMSPRGRPDRSAHHRRAREAAASATQRYTPRVAQSESLPEDDNSPDAPGALS
ncbi:hypothetical protein J4E91_003006 [Alternaria rosae]|nr:hypothetical protein J4E91_003006 [Alternaria rosae]